MIVRVHVTTRGHNITPSSRSWFYTACPYRRKPTSSIIIQKGSIHYTDDIVQSSATNGRRFIVACGVCVFLKPTEPALLSWWLKVAELAEGQGERENLTFHGAPPALPRLPRERRDPMEGAAPLSRTVLIYVSDSSRGIAHYTKQIVPNHSCASLNQAILLC